MNDEERFAFGKNWKAFLATLDEARIAQAVDSLRTMLGVDSLEGKSFLDLGCGSGLFSLAAHRLGAQVLSLDYDTDSVGCTQQLRDQFGSANPTWDIRQGSVLDQALMESLERFDIVYSWGVLHHTGDMDRALTLARERTAQDGLLFIAIYNDQGGASRRWLRIKQFYHRLPVFLRSLWVVFVAGCYEIKFAVARLVRLRNPLPFADWRAKKRDRGMSAWHDWGRLGWWVAVRSRYARADYPADSGSRVCLGKPKNCR